MRDCLSVGDRADTDAAGKEMGTWVPHEGQAVVVGSEGVRCARTDIWRTELAERGGGSVGVPRMWRGLGAVLRDGAIAGGR